jgi:hypothetical protein
MSPTKTALTVAGAFLLLSLPLQAQTNIAPPTYLENFELQTNTILVRGFSLIGSVALGNSSVTIRANEANDMTHSQKVYGIVVEISRTVEAGETANEFLVVDYDELDSLANAMDYVSKVTWGVTQLNGFEAGYKTKSGLRFIAHSDRRQDSVNIFIQSGDGPRIPATSDQLLQIRSLITQAKATLDGLK